MVNIKSTIAIVCKSLLLASCITILFSCSNLQEREFETTTVNGEELVLKNFYSEDGKLLAARTYKIVGDDTLLHGFERLFYATGQLQKEIYYDLGKKQGSEKCYYSNGIVEYTGWNKQDKKDSIWYYHYDRRVSAGQDTYKMIENWKNGIQTSHQSYFYENGGHRTYFFCDPVGHILYKREYDKEGSLIVEEGEKKPLIVIETTNPSTYEFKKGQVIKGRIYYIMPPNTEVVANLRGGGMYEDWTAIPIASYYTPIVFENDLNVEGEHKLEVMIKLTEKSGQVEEFTTDFAYSVE